jgi:hypothetical protein
MASSSKGTTSRRTIADYNLVRKIDKFMARKIPFVEPYIESSDKSKFNDSWVGYSISNPDQELCYYSVSIPLKAYVTYSVFLTSDDEVGSERITRMRYRDMMADNYLDAGGDLTTLRYIATKDILNISTRELIMQCFKQAGKNVAQAETVEFLPKDAAFDNTLMGNPFTRGIQGLLRQYEKEMGNAKIKRFIFISEGMRPDEEVSLSSPALHIVVELCRPGDDGYPDKQAA